MSCAEDRGRERRRSGAHGFESPEASDATGELDSRGIGESLLMFAGVLLVLMLLEGVVVVVFHESVAVKKVLSEPSRVDLGNR